MCLDLCNACCMCNQGCQKHPVAGENCNLDYFMLIYWAIPPRILQKEMPK